MRRIAVVPLLLMMLAGCEQRQLPTPSLLPVEARLVSARMAMIMGPGKTYRVEVETEGAIDSVRLEVRPAGQGAVEKIYHLHDDGGALHVNNRDYVAGDGFFSQSILWNPVSALSQDYTFLFIALRDGQQQGEALPVTVFSGVLIAPVIEAVILPDTLQSGFEGTVLFQALVSDSSGLDDIARVEMHGSAPGKAAFDTLLFDDGTHGDAVAGDGHYTLAISREFGARKSGLYEIGFTAVDRSGLKSAVVNRNLFIVNGKPVLSDLLAPEDVKRPVSGLSTHLVTIKVRDPQGAADIKRIWLRAFYPNGQGFSNNPFTMYDNGLPLDIDRWNLGYRGDEVAGDGIYSMTVLFDATQALGLYRFSFEAEDWMGNLGQILEHTLTLYQ